ncbi:MAG TPA: alkaline phosphatase family protein [Lichenihabitans sp.]|jgi:phospholipase C|nr:alkaline phosphatase family protein [Lichenihabitans sp.]
MKLVATTLLAISLAANGSALAQDAPTPTPPALVHLQPDPGADIAPYVVDPARDPQVSRDAMIAALRKKVKYVFVVFNENHSFDNEFGTFPGANGLFSDGLAPRDPDHTPGFVQHYKDHTGTELTLTPFRIGPEQNSTFIDSVDHSHKGLARKLALKDGSPTMAGFAEDEFGRFIASGGPKSAALATQYARLVMSYVDCDTIPFLWRYASRFTLFDNIFATEDTPSTPNAIAMIAGQSGETQWVKHGAEGKSYAAGENHGKTQGPPIVNDPQPFYGSQFDSTAAGRKPAGGIGEYYANTNIASNLTFATVPLTLAGRDAAKIAKEDFNADFDLPDVKQDIPFITSKGGTPVAWRWYQEGYDHEPTDGEGAASHDSYVSHHSAPQYFGYLSNNPTYHSNMRGLGDFFRDMQSGDIPADGGVLYIRGGFEAVSKQHPPIQNPNYPDPVGLTPSEIATINSNKGGDDDHPGYSDRQLSEGMAARVINAIAAKPEIWSQSAIIITYDESDGFYDHVPPRVLSYGPDQLPLARGIRVPMIVVSPYARAHAVSRAEGDHNAVIETISAIFDLPSLASLPDEAQALLKGEDAAFNGPNGFVQHYLGPRDINSPITDDLLSAFEPKRLTGDMPPLPADYAAIPAADVETLPHYGGKGCQAIGIVPEDRHQGIETKVAPGFNSLPITFPAYN